MATTATNSNIEFVSIKGKSGFLLSSKGCQNPWSANQKRHDFAKANGVTGAWVEIVKSLTSPTTYIVIEGDVQSKDGVTALTTESRKTAYLLRDKINYEVSKLQSIYGDVL